MNLANQAMSTISGWEFNSFCYWADCYLGAKSTGIYKLGSDHDAGVNIQSTIELGPMDFGRKVKTYLRDVWVNHRTDGFLDFTFSVDEKKSTEVTRRTVKSGSVLQEEKVKVPRGLLGRYYTIKINNVDGCDFDIDALSLMADVTGRKR